METRHILLFCGTCLALFLGLSAVLYPHAAVSMKTLQYSRTPQPSANIPDMNLGKNFGIIPVDELMGYYIDHPPAPPKAGSAPAPEQQFGGY